MAEEAIITDSEDSESDIDGCNISIAEATLDADLPPTEGGVVEEAGTPGSEDSESDIDGCDVSIAEATLDADLPATEGGVV